MRGLLRSCAIAFSMYSRLPVPMVTWTPENLRYAFCFFPLVGVLLGFFQVVWYFLWKGLGLSLSLGAAVAVALPLLVTGGIHLDGFCDTVDALSSHAPVQRKLEILKDPHIGAFGVMGCGIYLLVSFGLWTQLPQTPWAVGMIGLGYSFSRCLSGWAVVGFPLAKNSGLAATFAGAAQGKKLVGVVLIGEGLLCALGMFIIGRALAAAILIGTALLFLFYRRMSMKEFGGVTGDLAGWFLQSCELVILGVTAVLGGWML